MAKKINTTLNQTFPSVLTSLSLIISAKLLVRAILLGFFQSPIAHVMYRLWQDPPSKCHRYLILGMISGIETWMQRHKFRLELDVQNFFTWKSFAPQRFGWQSYPWWWVLLATHCFWHTPLPWFNPLTRLVGFTMRRYDWFFPVSQSSPPYHLCLPLLWS